MTLTEEEEEESLTGSRDALGVSLVLVRMSTHVPIEAPPDHSPSIPFPIHYYLGELITPPMWNKYFLPDLNRAGRANFATFEPCVLFSRISVRLPSQPTPFFVAFRPPNTSAGGAAIDVGSAQTFSNFFSKVAGHGQMSKFLQKLRVPWAGARRPGSALYRYTLTPVRAKMAL